MFLDKIVFQVEGMMCNQCVAKVKKELRSVKPIKKVKVDLETQLVSIFYKKTEEVDVNLIKESVEKLGFVFKGVL